eukprot:1186853-Prorocentrum_minimum.AAC.1
MCTRGAYAGQPMCTRAGQPMCTRGAYAGNTQGSRCAPMHSHCIQNRVPVRNNPHLPPTPHALRQMAYTGARLKAQSKPRSRLSASQWHRRPFRPSTPGLGAKEHDKWRRAHESADQPLVQRGALRRATHREQQLCAGKRYKYVDPIVWYDWKQSKGERWSAL